MEHQLSKSFVFSFPFAAVEHPFVKLCNSHAVSVARSVRDSFVLFHCGVHKNLNSSSWFVLENVLNHVGRHHHHFVLRHGHDLMIDHEYGDVRATASAVTQLPLELEQRVGGIPLVKIQNVKNGAILTLGAAKGAMIADKSLILGFY